uniref:Uncharacterized protein n=1 Tax=Pseudo-nitzschia australis TaxID=44445 RepID=A0A7S4AXD8_9STRA|mmetsp:Transcript_2319/g.4978  ORF Transcript_2319/g.4978 Transcript_2319/m.4978 type:complete len:482 (-) Transcript_2319:131-1576(-)
MASSEVEFLEERLRLLETWLNNSPDDDVNNEDLIQKREEYQGLIEETVLLEKKLRKTSKLLVKESDKNMLRKLSKKQDQYLNEIEEIMNYAESDVLFETAEIEPNELLGEPLETLVEQPGLEGSSSSLLNFSMSDFMPSSLRPDHRSEDLHPIAENAGPSPYAKNHESMESFSSGVSLFTTSTAKSNTCNYDDRTLRRKLKKVEKLLVAEEVACTNNEISQLDSIQVKKLRKKRDQYTQALQSKTANGSSSNKNNTNTVKEIPINTGVEKGCRDLHLEGDDEEGDNIEETLEGEVIDASKMEEDKKSHIERFHDSTISERRNNDFHGVVSHNKKTLTKKLKKLKKLMEATNDLEEVKKYRLKKKEYRKALEILNDQEMEDAETSSPSRYPQHEDIVDEKAISVDGDDAVLSSGCSFDSDSQNDDLLDQDNEEEIELLKKKIRKVVKLIAKARKEDDPKTCKKMEKKRLEYQTSLDELLDMQ